LSSVSAKAARQTFQQNSAKQEHYARKEAAAMKPGPRV